MTVNDPHLFQVRDEFGEPLEEWHDAALKPQRPEFQKEKLQRPPVQQRPPSAMPDDRKPKPETPPSRV